MSTAALPATEIAARRRPAAILTVYLVEAVVAWVLAAPWGETFARVLGAHPDGDRALWWEPGMPLVLDVQRRLGSVLGALSAATAIGLAVWALFGVFVLGALLAALDGESTFRAAVSRGAAAFFRLVAIGLVTLFVSLLVFVVIGVVPAYALSARLSSLEPASAFLVSLLPVLLALVAIAFLTAAADLARARVVRHDEGFVDAIGFALRHRAAVSALLALSVPRWVASLGLLGFGAAFSTRSQSVLAIFAVHQLFALLRVALRASVLARALRLSGDRPSA